jgi:hypothetical protein
MAFNCCRRVCFRLSERSSESGRVWWVWRALPTCGYASAPMLPQAQDDRAHAPTLPAAAATAAASTLTLAHDRLQPVQRASFPRTSSSPSVGIKTAGARTRPPPLKLVSHRGAAYDAACVDANMPESAIVLHTSPPPTPSHRISTLPSSHAWNDATQDRQHHETGGSSFRDLAPAPLALSALSRGQSSLPGTSATRAAPTIASDHRSYLERSAVAAMRPTSEAANLHDLQGALPRTPPAAVPGVLESTGCLEQRDAHAHDVPVAYTPSKMQEMALPTLPFSAMPSSLPTHETDTNSTLGGASGAVSSSRIHVQHPCHPSHLWVRPLDLPTGFERAQASLPGSTSAGSGRTGASSEPRIPPPSSDSTPVRRPTPRGSSFRDGHASPTRTPPRPSPATSQELRPVPYSGTSRDVLQAVAVASRLPHRTTTTLQAVDIGAPDIPKPETVSVVASRDLEHCASSRSAAQQVPQLQLPRHLAPSIQWAPQPLPLSHTHDTFARHSAPPDHAAGFRTASQPPSSLQQQFLLRQRSVPVLLSAGSASLLLRTLTVHGEPTVPAPPQVAPEAAIFTAAASVKGAAGSSVGSSGGGGGVHSSRWALPAPEPIRHLSLLDLPASRFGRTGAAGRASAPQATTRSGATEK